MAVQVERAGQQPDALDPRFLARLSQRRVGERPIALLTVAAELDPEPAFAVERHEDLLTRLVDDEARCGQMRGRPIAPDTVGMPSKVVEVREAERLLPR